MDGEEFMLLAGKLAAGAAADEASMRTAVSRAYYGAFHLARRFLEDIGCTPPAMANVQVFVQHYLHGSGHPDACRVASFLADLHAARNRADYQLSNRQVGTRPYAILNVETAHNIRAALLLCREDAARAAIQSGIADYRRRINA